MAEPSCLCAGREKILGFLAALLLFSRGWSDFSKVRGGLWQSSEQTASAVPQDLPAWKGLAAASA